MSRITHAKEVILTSDTTGKSWSAAVWDPRNGSMLSVYKNATALGHRSLQILSDSYVLGADATKPRIHIWPLNNPSPLPNIRLTTPGKVNALTTAVNGSYIIAAVGEKLFIWQTCNGKLWATITKHYQTINCLATTSDGSLFASAGEDGLIFVWSLFSALNDQHCSPFHTFSNHSLAIKDLYFGCGGARSRLFSISLDRKANIYEMGSGHLLVSFVFDVPLTALTVNSLESELYVGCTTGDILQYNLYKPPHTIEHHVKVSSSDESNETAVFKAHNSDVTALSVSVDCRTLVSGSTDGAVHLWDILSRQVLRTIQHKGPVTAAFFTRGYANFRVTTLKPSLMVCNLQRTSDDGGRGYVIEVISRGRNPADIVDFESFVADSINSQESKELESMKEQNEKLKEENERLKKINLDLYKYSLKNLLDEIDDS